MKCSLVVFVVVVAGGCVKSSGVDPPPGGDEKANTVVVDGGDRTSFDSVSVEVAAGGGEYADGRKARVQGLAGDLNIFIEIGSFAGGAQNVVPFGAAHVSAKGGANFETSYEGLSGTLTVDDGDGASGSSLTITLKNIDLVDVCTGEHRTIDEAHLTGDAVDGDFTDTIGVGGFILSDDVETSFYDPFSYVGIMGAQLFTNSSGVSFFQAGSAESCLIGHPRPNHTLFTLAIVPGEIPAGGGEIALAAMDHSFVFMTEATSTGTKVRQALATSGTITFDNSDVTLTDGSVMSGTLNALSYAYLDANLDFTNDPPMTVASMKFSAIFGKPVIP